MKKILISPYFGKLPNYFQLFLDSCALNQDFCDFLIITDDKTHYDLPTNVRIILVTFNEFNLLVKEKIGEAFRILSPYKICDYRPAFGKIFEDYIAGYDFWGHIDTDLVLGKLSNFLPEDAFLNSDRLLERGALMLYANKQNVNNLFYQELDGIINFAEAAKTEEPCFYDEIMFPALLSKNGFKTYSNTSYADILPQYLKFTIDAHCKINNKLDQSFVYESNVGLFQVSSEDDELVECMYIHIQKRSMKIDVNLENIPSLVYIHENNFNQKPHSTTISQYRELSWKIRYIRRQLSKLDFNHVRIHMKTRIIRKRIEW